MKQIEYHTGSWHAQCHCFMHPPESKGMTHTHIPPHQPCPLYLVQDEHVLLQLLLAGSDLPNNMRDEVCVVCVCVCACMCACACVHTYLHMYSSHFHLTFLLHELKAFHTKNLEKVFIFLSHLKFWYSLTQVPSSTNSASWPSMKRVTPSRDTV